MNPFARVLLGRGRVPEHLRESLGSEGVLLSEEGLKAHITYRDYRSAGRFSNWRRMWLRVALVVTRSRLAVYTRDRPVLDFSFGDPKIGKLQLSATDSGLVLGTADASDFNPLSTGRVELLVRTSDPAAALAWIEAQQRSHGQA